MVKIERRPEGGGRMYLSIRKRDVLEFEQALTALESACDESASQIIVRLVKEAAQKLDQQPGDQADRNE